MDGTGNSGAGEMQENSAAPEPLLEETPLAPPAEEPGADARNGDADEADAASALIPSGVEVMAPADAGETMDQAALARDLLDQIVQAMGIEASVDVEQQGDGSVRLMVEGPEIGVVIGKHGTTINALQYLVGLIVQKRTGDRVRLVIDAEGYRSRREQALKEMARTYAQRVKETGNEAVLDALQSYERRIIHNCLADDPDVFTYSEGEEPDRRVVISPREARDDLTA